MYPRNSFSNVRLHPKTHATLKKVSRKLGKPMTDIMAELVEKHLREPSSRAKKKSLLTPKPYPKKKAPAKKKVTTKKKVPAKKIIRK